MTGFTPSVVRPGAAAQDPTKHVNYVLGMVLGVDDLTQQFAYHAQRDLWTVRDLAGYGTVWGLAVTVRDAGARGPEVVVSPGVAANPRGQLIRVAPAQCAALNDWLKPRGTDVLARRIATANPNLFQLPVHVVLSYRSCETDPVPIAGEPCRSEDDATAPSRVADDFLLELAFDPPPQDEEDAIGEFVRWLRAHLVVTAGGAASLDVPQFLAAIRAAADAAAAEVSSPVSSPPGAGRFLLDTSPITPLAVPAALLGDYLRAAARLWATELRPRWRPNWLGEKHGCAGTDLLSAPEEGNRLLLASLMLTVGPDGLNSAIWKVLGPVAITEDARPVLLHLRLLQEWLITQAAARGPTALAAGIVQADGTPTGRAVAGGLAVIASTSDAAATRLRLAFDGYAAPPALGGPQYVVKALPWSALPNLTVAFGGFEPDGFTLAVSKGGAPLTAPELQGLQLLVEVSQVG